MLQNYIPILMFMVIGLLLGLVPIAIDKILAFLNLRPHKPDAAKLAPFECGFEAFEDARAQFDVRFYLVAILFIIFDLEIAFLFPWAVILHHISWFGFFAMGLFLAILVVGFIYEWRKGALEWE
jgi:NADH-quinone oxidoreductase subunit A